ncbi:MAG: amidohydrolase family protein [Spirochaetota bacterium]|nr:amidohydrolase family protein [Spirochaetota bacterium]
MTIFDGHTHLGLGFEPDNLIVSMEKYNITLALVSIISDDLDTKANNEMVQLAKKHKQLRGLAWCNPINKKNSAQEIEHFFRDGKLIGMKFHPSLNMYSVTDPSVEPYMELCVQYDIPAQFHTQPDEYCNPNLMLKLALRHPQVKIIMVHMNLGNKGSDNDVAIDAAKNASNLLLDTTWVPSEKVIKAVKGIGKDRIIFGTDAPVGNYYRFGDYEHYDHYFLFNAIPFQEPPFISYLQKRLSPDEYDHVMYLNAKRIYHL